MTDINCIEQVTFYVGNDIVEKCKNSSNLNFWCLLYYKLYLFGYALALNFVAALLPVLIVFIFCRWRV